jgi:hypothetical protein
METPHHRADARILRLAELRAATVPPGTVASSFRRTALAAMHAADPLAAQRRLPARPVVVLAPGLAARHQSQIPAPPVACGQQSTGHGVGGNFHIPPPLSLPPCGGAQRGEVEPAVGEIAVREAVEHGLDV